MYEEKTSEKASMQMPKFSVKLSSHKKAFDVLVPNGVQAKWEMERARKGYPTTDEAPTMWASWCCWEAAKKAKQIDAGMPFEAFLDELEILGFDEPVEAHPSPRAAEAD